MTMTVSMKGQYEGTETISTPAGEFDCVKVTYSMKVKFFMFRMKVRLPNGMLKE